MQEVKKPRKPLIYYYVIVLIVLLVFNFLLMPWAAERQVREVSYDTFMQMTEEKDIGPLALFISFLDIYCPIPTKIRMGRIHDSRNVRIGEACSMI